MKFDDLDARLRSIETAEDRYLPPGGNLIARLDGRSFTKLTKETLTLEAPFDVLFRSAMEEAVRHLMSCFKMDYGYCQSDEISLLFAVDETAFGRKERKLLSVLAGEASARLSLTIGHPAAFDCRLLVLPSEQLVVDYFRWRREDAQRNCLGAHCYWTLRRAGKTPAAAARVFDGMSQQQKVAFLAEQGIVWTDIPAWQRGGVAFVYREIEKEAVNPRTGEPTRARRRRLEALEDVPDGQLYTDFLTALLQGRGSPPPRSSPGDRGVPPEPPQ